MPDPVPLAARSWGEGGGRDPRERTWAEKAAGSWGQGAGFGGLGTAGNLATGKYCNSFSN